MVDLARIKKHLRLSSTFTEDDEYLIELRDTAIQLIETYIEKPIALIDPVPLVLKQAILVKITDFYDVERGTYITGITKNEEAFQSLIQFYKEIHIY